MKLIKDDIKRCAIFLFYDRDGIVDDYVVYLLKELKKNVDNILVVCNGRIPEESERKFRTITQDILVRDNAGFDVGGYREGLFYYGFQKLQSYDELIMLNYTFFGPIYPFEEMFDDMSNRDVDFWGITGHFKVEPDPYGQNRYGYLPEHIQSHFLVLRRSLFLSSEYKDFIINMRNPRSYIESICDYESIFRKHFEDLGFVGDLYCDEKEYEGYVYNPVMFRLKDMLISKRCPIIKRRSFFTNYQDFMLNSCGETTAEVYEYLKENNLYDLNLIWDNLLRLENMTEICRAMQLNYMLPESECQKEYVAEHKVAIIIYVQSAKHMIEYEKYLAEIDEHTSCIIVGESKELEQIKKNPFLQKEKFIYKIWEGGTYAQMLCEILESVKEKAEYVGILEMKDCEKEQPYSNAVSWQYSDWKNVMASKAYVNNIIQTLRENERLGMLIPPIPNFGTLFANAQDGWYGKYDSVKHFLEKMDIGVSIKREDEPRTPIGGSFWLKTETLKGNKTDFNCLESMEDEKETLLTIPFLIQNAGFYIGTAYNTDYAPVSITNSDYRMRELNKVAFEKYGPSYHSIVVDRIKKNEFEAK